MTTNNKKKIDKIYKQIDSLAKKGKDQVFEYYKLIDEIINKSEYDFFEQCMYVYYKIDIVGVEVSVIKKKTWSEILFQTNTSFLTSLKKMYDKKLVYQTGFNVYTQDVNSLIGQIKEIELYTQDVKYLIENKEFAKIMGSREVYLEVLKTGATSSVIIGATSSKSSPDQKLLNRYSQAIDILLS